MAIGLRWDILIVNREQGTNFSRLGLLAEQIKLYRFRLDLND